MILTFYTKADASLTQAELDAFEQEINKNLPDDYRQHMMQYNGCGVNQINLAHAIDPTYTAYGLSYLFPLKHSHTTIETILSTYASDYPSGYIPIGVSDGGGEFIMSLNDDSTHGEVKILEEDGIIEYLSPSFNQFLEDIVEAER